MNNSNLITRFTTFVRTLVSDNDSSTIPVATKIPLPPLTQERLKEALHYDPETGLFTWKISRYRIKIGDIAGADTNGYISIGLDNRRYAAHRLAFLYMTGSMPDMVDHKDGDPSNNAWDNLRPTTPSQNAFNRKVRSDNKLGVKGVQARGKRFAALYYDGQKLKHIGTFDTAEEAHKAYCEAATERDPEFFRAA